MNRSKWDSDISAEYLGVGADGKHAVANGSSVYFDLFRIPDVDSNEENTLTVVQLRRLAELCTGHCIGVAAAIKMTSQMWLEELERSQE